MKDLEIDLTVEETSLIHAWSCLCLIMMLVLNYTNVVVELCCCWIWFNGTSVSQFL